MLAAYATHASSSPLPPPSLSLLLLFLPGTPLRALAIAFYIGSLSLKMTCQPCLPGHLESEKAWWLLYDTTADLSIAKGLIEGEHIALAP